MQGYGERTNTSTQTITINPGIDIAAGPGAAVKAAERGRVSMVSWLPGYGTFVILEHREGYRTVYANLESASVSRGASIPAGGRIGTVGKSEGTFVHFQIWNEHDRLDPVTVLP